MRIVEFRVRPVTRWIVTRYENDSETESGSLETLGEYSNEWYAKRVKNALESHEKEHPPEYESLPSHPPPKD